MIDCNSSADRACIIGVEYSVAVIVGPFVLPKRPIDAPFVKYTLPAYELRRLLRDGDALPSF